MKSVGDDVEMSYFIFTFSVCVDGHWETLGAKTKNSIQCENNNIQHRKGLHYYNNYYLPCLSTRINPIKIVQLPKYLG